MFGSDLQMIQTIGNDYILMAQNFYLKDINYVNGIPKKIYVSPHLPYLYIPDADYTHFGFKFNEIYPNAGTEDGFDCSFTDNHCRFSKSCTEI